MCICILAYLQVKSRTPERNVTSTCVFIYHIGEDLGVCVCARGGVGVVSEFSVLGKSNTPPHTSRSPLLVCHYTISNIGCSVWVFIFLFQRVNIYSLIFINDYTLITTLPFQVYLNGMK